VGLKSDRHGSESRFAAYVEALTTTLGHADPVELGAIFAPGTWERCNPANTEATRNRLTIQARLGLLIRTTCIFVLLSPAEMILRFAHIIPGIRPIRFMDSVFTYLSSVQLYQERQSSQSGTLVDFDQSRRMSIQRRMANFVVTMSENQYDRWYIFGHSLGSVIAFKALMYDGAAFARFMSYRRWHHPALDKLKCAPNVGSRDALVSASQETAVSASRAVADPSDPITASEAGNDANQADIDSYVDCPKCPNWLPEDASLDRARLFSKLRGLVTYGSPLETFAKTWPAIVQLRDKIDFNRDFEWVNIYDPTDIVAPVLQSFGHADPNQRGVFRPKNVPVD
jgi:hypothetical protein